MYILNPPLLTSMTCVYVFVRVCLCVRVSAVLINAYVSHLFLSAAF